MQCLRQFIRHGYRAAVERSPLGRSIQWRVPVPGGVALTFDDGPDPEQTPRILDVLARYRAPATFFLLGEQVERHPELVLRMAAEGHEIGNHTYAHLRCRAASRSTLQEQLERTDVAIQAALGARADHLPAFRPPFGELRVQQALYLAAKGRTLAFWSADSRDYRGATASQIAAMGFRLVPGDIVLLHDRFPATVAALPELLEAILASGLRPVPVSCGSGRHAAQPEPALASPEKPAHWNSAGTEILS